MRYIELKEYQIEKTTDYSGLDLLVYINPTILTLKNIHKKYYTVYKDPLAEPGDLNYSLRGYFDNKKFYFWDANTITHKQLSTQLDLSYFYINTFYVGNSDEYNYDLILEIDKRSKEIRTHTFITSNFRQISEDTEGDLFVKYGNIR